MRTEAWARIVLTAAMVCLGAGGMAAELTLKTADKPAPKEVSESIRALVQPKAIQLFNGEKPVIEIWLRKEVPLKGKPASASDTLGAIPETTLLGVISIQSPFKDYKDNEISKGVYTARFALQPQDGDHLGTAEFSYFLALIAADNDKDPAGIAAFRPMVKASGKLTSSGHPAVISLRPAPASDAAPKLTEPAAEHKAIRLKLPAKAGADKSKVAFDLVYEGHGHIQ